MEKRRILVIEDDPETVDMLRMVLERASYEVVAAYDGQEGVEKARAEKPDAIILDLMMPEKDGFAACKELKEDRECADIPILVVTALPDYLPRTWYAKTMALDLESEDYIDKPVDHKELLRRIGELLELRHRA